MKKSFESHPAFNFLLVNFQYPWFEILKKTIGSWLNPDVDPPQKPSTKKLGSVTSIV